jgi:RNA polymerase sigma factor (sigma-70 family)
MVSDQPTLTGQPLTSEASGVSASAIVAELPRLRRHARGLLYNTADADDLVQDCIEAALRKKDSLSEPAKLRGWLFAILNNFLLMRHRAHARRGATLQIEVFADSLAAATAPHDGDAARDVARAMAKLSIEHRQVLLLLNVEGYGYRQAADILDIPIGTVMSRLARARERLRALLEGGKT